MILDETRVIFPKSLIKVEKASCCDMMSGCSTFSSGGSSNEQGNQAPQHGFVNS
jgi:hypothetical protein